MKGIILVDKPRDWTSMDVCAKLRGVFHEKKIGHSGTLDPLATGLLVVFIGRATRAVQFAENDSKTYLAGLRLGTITDTQDITGNILEERNVFSEISDVKIAADKFLGDIRQIPPMYSAIKVNGQKLYDIARKGGEIERKARDITIHKIEVLEREALDYSLEVSCSKGTYIRTLCNDIGAELGCGACMSSLRRVRAGVFRIEEAHKLQDIISASEEDRMKMLLPVDSLFSDLPEITVDEKQERLLRNGNVFSAKSPDGKCRVYSRMGEFLALCTADGGKLRQLKSFYEV